jgi:hypothetical protein
MTTTMEGAGRQLQAARRVGAATGRGWLARAFWPKTSARGRHLTKAKARARLARSARAARQRAAEMS